MSDGSVFASISSLIQMPRQIPTTPRKLPQQDRSKITVDAILTATARIKQRRDRILPQNLDLAHFGAYS